jgi:hypothetical protein
VPEWFKREFTLANVLLLVGGVVAMSMTYSTITHRQDVHDEKIRQLQAASEKTETIFVTKIDNLQTSLQRLELLIEQRVSRLEAAIGRQQGQPGPR